jgi:hypothetical protein
MPSPLSMLLSLWALVDVTMMTFAVPNLTAQAPVVE